MKRDNAFSGGFKIAVVGLGLIGGSFCKALKGKFEIDGRDREEVLQAALKDGAIGGAAKDLSLYDAVFLCVPPAAALDIIRKEKFKSGALVADFCGVKREIVRAAEEKLPCCRYVGCHPMAGREVSGYGSSRESLFAKASLIITVTEKTDWSGVEMVKAIAAEAGFSRFPVCSPEYHDAKIAYTSQLAHIVSNAYVKSEQAEEYAGFTGGSFQDMTRIAAVDEKLWSDLFIMNRDFLAKELDNLIVNLNGYLDALKSGEGERLAGLLAEGKRIKNSFFKSGFKN